MVNVLMAQPKSPSKMATHMMAIFTMGYWADRELLLGLMELYTLENLQIIVSLEKAFTNGQMEVLIKAKSKTGFGMDTESIQLMKLRMREIGLMEKRRAKEKSSLKVEVSSKVTSRMIWSTVTEKCITILLVIFLRGNGEPM